jgi:hypothetical protein
MTRQQGQADLTKVPRRSLFERWDQLGKVRGKARSHFFTTLRRFAETDDARAITYELMEGLLDGRPVLPHGSEPALHPYPGLGHPRHDGRTSKRDDIVFITGRFRSGSTLLWNIFRNLPDCTAYYEPHNERRWFDPQSRGSHTDPSHRQVSDYWLEYQGLEELGHYYRRTIRGYGRSGPSPAHGSEWNDRLPRAEIGAEPTGPRGSGEHDQSRRARARTVRATDGSIN